MPNLCFAQGVFPWDGVGRVFLRLGRGEARTLGELFVVFDFELILMFFPFGIARMHGFLICGVEGPGLDWGFSKRALVAVGVEGGVSAAPGEADVSKGL